MPDSHESPSGPTYGIAAGSPGYSDGADIGLVRYRANGRLDPRFGGDGRVRTDIGGLADVAYGIARAPRGRLVVVGMTDSGDASTGEDIFVARYRRNGRLDRRFATNGVAVTRFSNDWTRDRARDVKVTSDGKILVVGFGSKLFDSGGGVGGMAVLRYRRNGKLDRSFAGDGKRLIDVTSGDDEARGVAVQRDGRIILAGPSGISAADEFALARLRRNGAIDRSFSGDGVVLTNFGACGGADVAEDVFLRGRKIMVVGYSYQCSGANDFAVARYRSNGRLDRTFSRDGRVTFDFPGPADQPIDQAYAGAALSHGRTLLGGWANGPTIGSKPPGEDFALAVIKRNGRLDRRFSGDGRKTFDNSHPGEFAYAMAQRKKRFVLAGTSPRTRSTWDYTSLVGRLPGSG